MKGGHTRDLQQRIIRFATLGVLFATVVVALVTIPTLYLTSRKHSEETLAYAIRSEAITVRELVGKARDVAEQIASRTHARRLLAAHDRGEITLDTLRRFTRPIIEDALAHAPEIRAFQRLDLHGDQVARAGDFPDDITAPPLPPARVRIHPYPHDGQLMLLVNTPVLDRREGPLGQDLALFRLNGLERLIRDKPSESHGRLMLAWQSGHGWQLLDGEGVRPAPPALAERLDAPPPLEHGPLESEGENNRILMILPVSGTPLTLILEASAASVYAQASQQLLIISAALVALALFSLWGTRRIIRPLAGKILIRNDELNQRIARQTAELERANRILRLHSAAVDSMIHAAREEELVSAVCRVLVEQGRYHFAWMGYGDGDTPLRMVAHHAPAEHGIILLPTEAGEAAREALRRREVVVEHRLDPAALASRWHLGGASSAIRAAIALPLHHGEEAFGVLAVFSCEAEAFTQGDELGVLTEIAEDLAYGIATLRLQAERAATEQERRKLSSAIEQTANIVMITDRQGVIEYVNPEFEKVTGYSREEIVGCTPAVLTSGRHDSTFYERMWNTLLKGEVFRETFVNQRKNGDLYYEDKTITPIRDEAGEITHFVSTGKDITDRIKTQERVYYLAYHDVLTGLPNRTLFRDRLGHAVRKAERSGELVALMFIDLDRFKHINDSLGHQAGDELLCEVAQRISQCVRQGDTVARLGGDEFTVIAEGLENPEKAAVIAENLIQAITAPIALRGQEVYVSASIGIALFPDDAENVDGLLRAADTAMYRAKEEGRNNYQFHTADMTAKAFERVLMESALRHALERDEFQLCYQPRIDLEQGRVVCLEALLRWRHPQKGLIMPAQFIPVLEETGLIVPITEWLIHRVCDQIETWQQEGQPVCRISINLSAVHFRSQRLLGFVRDLIAQRDIDPTLLELEITESMLMEDLEASAEVLRALRDMGLHITVDDFGTGFSSLAYLKRLPISCLKVDRSFVRDLPEDAEDRAIVEAIVYLAHTLGLRVTAEGVENPVQLHLLREMGCNEIQGTLFSPPLEADAIPTWLRESAAGLPLVQVVEGGERA